LVASALARLLADPARGDILTATDSVVH